MFTYEQHLQLYHSAFAIPLNIEIPFFRIPTLIPVLIIVYEVVTSKYSSWFIKVLLSLFWVGFFFDFISQGALQTDDVMFHLKHSLSTHLVGDMVLIWLSFLVEDLRIRDKLHMDPSAANQQANSFRPEALNLVILIAPPMICLLSYHGPWYTATSQIEKDKHVWELITFMKRNAGLYESVFQNYLLHFMTANLCFLAVILFLRPLFSGSFRSCCFDILNVSVLLCFCSFVHIFYLPLQVTMMEIPMHSADLPADWIWKMFAAHILAVSTGITMIFISWMAQEAFRLDTIHITATDAVAAAEAANSDSKQKKT